MANCLGQRFHRCPAAPEPPPRLPSTDDESGFQPIRSRSAADFGGSPAVTGQTFDVSFKPRRELYAKGNEAALLLRDLSRIGK